MIKTEAEDACRTSCRWVGAERTASQKGPTPVTWWDLSVWQLRYLLQEWVFGLLLVCYWLFHCTWTDIRGEENSFRHMFLIIHVTLGTHSCLQQQPGGVIVVEDPNIYSLRLVFQRNKHSFICNTLTLLVCLDDCRTLLCSTLSRRCWKTEEGAHR